MLALIYETVADPMHAAAWWLAVLWLFRCLCLWSFFFGGCPCCGTCNQCTSSTPGQLQVVVAGFSDDTCSNCDEGYNGTFVLDRAVAVPAFCAFGSLLSTNPANALYDCQWLYVVSPTCTALIPSAGHVDRMVATVRAVQGLRVFYLRGDDCNAMHNWHSSPADFDCGSWSGFTVPFFSDSNFTNGVTPCNSDNSDITVTSL